MAAQSQTAKKDKGNGGKSTPTRTKKKKEPEKKLAAVDSKKEPEKKLEAEKLTPTTDCKVFGSPDPNHKKCRTCKDLDNCLKLETQKKEAKGKGKSTSKQTRGRDFIGFLRGSKKSQFALMIAKKPRFMSEVKEAPWNKPNPQTFYDAFNELHRNKTEDEKEKPLAARNKEGKMFIVEKNLTKAQKEQMKQEVESVDY